MERSETIFKDVVKRRRLSILNSRINLSAFTKSSDKAVNGRVTPCAVTLNFAFSFIHHSRSSL
jgi:hypothetical protein